MDLVLPQIGSFRPVEGQPVPVLKEEVLSLTIKPAEFKPPWLIEEAGTPVGHDILKHPRRFQALSAAAIPAKPVSPVEEGAEVLTEPEVPKHPRRFQALAAAGPAKVANRFSRQERTAEAAATSMPDRSASSSEVPDEGAITGPKLQLPIAVLTALARAELTSKNSPPMPPSIVDGTVRRSKERRGVPPTLQERRVGETIYDW